MSAKKLIKHQNRFSLRVTNTPHATTSTPMTVARALHATLRADSLDIPILLAKPVSMATSSYEVVDVGTRASSVLI
jgi:hypothetical protein